MGLYDDLPPTSDGSTDPISTKPKPNPNTQPTPTPFPKEEEDAKIEENKEKAEEENKKKKMGVTMFMPSSLLTSSVMAESHPQKTKHFNKPKLESQSIQVQLSAGKLEASLDRPKRSRFSMPGPPIEKPDNEELAQTTPVAVNEANSILQQKWSPDVDAEMEIETNISSRRMEVFNNPFRELRRRKARKKLLLDEQRKAKADFDLDSENLTAWYQIPEIDHEYDPFNPNNYEVYVEQRLEENRSKEVRFQLQQQEKKRREEESKRKQEVLESFKAIPAGEEQSMGRGRGRGMIVPAWMKTQES